MGIISLFCRWFVFILLNATETIVLNSFLRKTLKAYALKANIRALGATLVRKGRSRHWQLTATREQMRSIIAMLQGSEEMSWQWLIAVLQTSLIQWTEQELANLVKLNPAISVNELVSRTDCTIALARKVLDDVEWAND